MPDSTKIHFTDGQSLVVEQGPRVVVENLGKGLPFVKFTKRNGGRTVYIASGQVTHLEQLPGERPAPGADKERAGPGADADAKPKTDLRGKALGRAVPSDSD